MRVEPAPSPGPSASDASDLLRSVVSGDSSVNQSTREALQRLLCGEANPSSPPADTPPAPADATPAPARKVTPAKPVPPVASGSMDARRLAALAYVRRMRISAR
jgi:hypothetical protein